MLFRRSRSQRNSRKAATRARRDRLRLCGLEPLEQRRLLAAFDIDGYTQIGTDIELDDLGPDFRDYSGVAYSDVTDSIFIVDNRNNLGAPHNHNHIIEYTVAGLSGSFIEMDGFVDVESIIHLDGDRFAVVEEREQVGRPAAYGWFCEISHQGPAGVVYEGALSEDRSVFRKSGCVNDT